MTDVVKKTAKTGGKKAAIVSTKTDKTLLKDAKERVMRLQKKSKKKTPKVTTKAAKNLNVFKKKGVKRGVVYLGHLPHGFYEEELRGFFSQFGKVVRVKVSRSKKTGKSKGYAFVEFAHEDVAKIVAETMNNYLMFERLLKAQYIPPDKVHPSMFPVRWITPESYPALTRRTQMKKKQEITPTDVQKNNHRSRISRKISKSVSALKEMGITYAPQVFDPDFVGTEPSQSDDTEEEIPQLVSIIATEPIKETTDKASPQKRSKIEKQTPKKVKTPARVAKPSPKTPEVKVTPSPKSKPSPKQEATPKKTIAKATPKKTVAQMTPRSANRTKKSV